MSLTKITLSGNVLKNPEKRFTENNLAICSFPLDFGYEGQDKQVNVVAIGKIADRVAETVQKGQAILVEGRLQTTTKNEQGVDKKYTEINAQGIEIIEKSSQNNTYKAGLDNESDQDVNSDDLIGEDEIPF